MTGDKNKFTSLTLKDGGNVKFGDNSKGNIIGIGNIGIGNVHVLKRSPQPHWRGEKGVSF